MLCHQDLSATEPRHGHAATTYLSFGYQILRIIKSSSLGVGSYGAVYRALCDELPCATKILHPTLFETNDPGTRKIMERFEQECQFLSGVRHPHIVQYLGVSRDPESGLPVLLMTRFLEHVCVCVCVCVCVICYDVVCACRLVPRPDPSICWLQY